MKGDLDAIINEGFKIDKKPHLLHPTGSSLIRDVVENHQGTYDIVLYDGSRIFDVTDENIRYRIGLVGLKQRKHQTYVRCNKAPGITGRVDPGFFDSSSDTLVRSLAHQVRERERVIDNMIPGGNTAAEGFYHKERILRESEDFNAIVQNFSGKSSAHSGLKQNVPSTSNVESVDLSAGGSSANTGGGSK